MNSGCLEDPQDTDLVLVTSPDGGAHWTQPFTIESNPGSYFFPWIAAGSAGIVNAVYYKSDTRQPNNPTSIWYIGHTRVTDAVATYTTGPNATYVSPPQFQEQNLDPDPVHGNGTTGGGICTFGLFCSAVPGANRTLADSIAVSLDPAGGVNAVWTDSINTPAGKFIKFKPFPRGTSGWQDYAIDFTTDERTRAVLIAIRRQPCAIAPCAAIGQVWVDDFSLAKS